MAAVTLLTYYVCRRLAWHRYGHVIRSAVCSRGAFSSGIVLQVPEESQDSSYGRTHHFFWRIFVGTFVFYILDS